MTGEARYAVMFERLRGQGEGAFVPFAMVGDPAPARSAGVLRALIEGGADALELGIPFSDPIADGPVIQAAAVRALAAGARAEVCWELIREAHEHAPAVPIGLLVYANLVFHGGMERFYAAAAAAGVSSVLVADVPVHASAPFVRAAEAEGIAPVFIATPNADEARLQAVAQASRGYTYVVTRAGVTGAEEETQDRSVLLETLRRHGAAPPVLGFGIATPAQVRAALRMGAAGAISGSAVVSRVAEHAGEPARMEASLRDFVAQMKAATRGAG